MSARAQDRRVGEGDRDNAASDPKHAAGADDQPPLDLFGAPCGADAEVIKPKRRRGAAPDETIAPPTPAGRLLVVAPGELRIDMRFGLDVETFHTLYGAEVEARRTSLLAGQPQLGIPVVCAGDHGLRWALTELPLVVAAVTLVAEGRVLDPLTVIECEKVDGEALLATVFDRRRNPCLFEQALYVRGCERRYGGRRAWMRAENIDVGRWEARLSKVARLVKGDASLGGAVDPYTIANVEDARRILDAYANPELRPRVEAALRAVAGTCANPLNAAVAFKAVVAALDGVAAQPELGEWQGDVRRLVAADGTVVATIRREGAGWSIAGDDVGALTRTMLGGMLKALTS